MVNKKTVQKKKPATPKKNETPAKKKEDLAKKKEELKKKEEAKKKKEEEAKKRELEEAKMDEEEDVEDVEEQKDEDAEKAEDGGDAEEGGGAVEGRDAEEEEDAEEEGDAEEEEFGAEDGEAEAEDEPMEEELLDKAEDEEESEEQAAADADGTEDSKVEEIGAADEGDDDVIVINDDDAEKNGSTDATKKDKKHASWVDIIERERDNRLSAELSKINKLKSANQKGKEIMELARTHRVHMYPIYPQDLSDPYIVDIMKKCTQTNIRFASSKNKEGEQTFCGLLELSFTKLKDAEENKEKLSHLRDDIKFVIGGHRNKIDDFTNNWKDHVGLPGNADANNKLTLFAPSLPECVTCDELWELFSKAREIWLVPGSPRQHAYIKFANEETLQATITELKARGPPHKDFNFVRLVRFYDVQRVIKKQTGQLRHGRRDSVGSASGRRSLSARDRSRERRRDRRSPERKTSKSPRAASSQSKTAAAKDSKDSKDSSKSKSPAAAAKTSTSKADSKPKETKPSDKDKDKGKDRDAKKSSSSTSSRPKDRSRSRERTRASRWERDRGRRNVSPVGRNQARGGRQQRMGGDVRGRNNAEPQAWRFRDDRVASILGEPPNVPSLMAAPMMNQPMMNSPLERSLNQLTQPSRQMPMPMQRMPEENQPGLQVLDSLLSTLGQLSGGGNNPIEALTHALHPGAKEYSGDRQRRSVPEERGYDDRRDFGRGRSPMKRAPSPRGLSPMRELEMKRRREQSRPATEQVRSRDYQREIPRDIPRDNYNQMPTAANITDAFKNLPKREGQPAARRETYPENYPRRVSSPTQSRSNYDMPRATLDSYASSATSRLSRPADYATLHAEAKGEITRMENEYARMMDQLGQQQQQKQQQGAGVGTARQTAGYRAAYY